MPISPLPILNPILGVIGTVLNGGDDSSSSSKGNNGNHNGGLRNGKGF